MKGGAMAAIEQGWQQQEIHQSAYRYMNEIEQNKRNIVGVNHGVMDELQSIPVTQINPQIGEEQASKLAQLRLNRDQHDADRCLQKLRDGISNGDNLFPHVIDAVRARCTLGEIMNVMKDDFGTYMAPSGF
jgi:methylmalonyl-CoA mutase N-terminal domain/subunit